MEIFRLRGQAALVIALACLGPGAPGAFAAAKAEGAEEQSKDPFTNLSQIAHEIRMIEERLRPLEKSVTAIEHSLAPVGAAVKPEALREVVNHAGDVVFMRGLYLILIATACGAGLLVLQAFLRRRTGPARQG